MVKRPKFRPPTESEIAIALERGRREHQFDALRLTYHPRRDSLTFELVNGVVVDVPRSIVGYLDGLSREQLLEMRLLPLGGALEIESLDLDLSVQGVVRSAVGCDWARQAGRAKTPKKAEAARVNGAKGGRPRKKVAS